MASREESQTKSAGNKMWDSINACCCSPLTHVAEWIEPKLPGSKDEAPPSNNPVETRSAGPVVTDQPQPQRMKMPLPSTKGPEFVSEPSQSRMRPAKRAPGPRGRPSSPPAPIRVPRTLSPLARNPVHGPQLTTPQADSHDTADGHFSELELGSPVSFAIPGLTTTSGVVAQVVPKVDWPPTLKLRPTHQSAGFPRPDVAREEPRSASSTAARGAESSSVAKTIPSMHTSVGSTVKPESHRRQPHIIGSPHIAPSAAFRSTPPKPAPSKPAPSTPTATERASLSKPPIIPHRSSSANNQSGMAQASESTRPASKPSTSQQTPTTGPPPTTPNWSFAFASAAASRTGSTAISPRSNAAAAAEIDNRRRNALAGPSHMGNAVSSQSSSKPAQPMSPQTNPGRPREISNSSNVVRSPVDAQSRPTPREIKRRHETNRSAFVLNGTLVSPPPPVTGTAQSAPAAPEAPVSHGISSRRDTTESRLRSPLSAGRLSIADDPRNYDFDDDADAVQSASAAPEAPVSRKVSSRGHAEEPRSRSPSSASRLSIADDPRNYNFDDDANATQSAPTAPKVPASPAISSRGNAEEPRSRSHSSASRMSLADDPRNYDLDDSSYPDSFTDAILAKNKERDGKRSKSSSDAGTGAETDPSTGTSSKSDQGYYDIDSVNYDDLGEDQKQFMDEIRPALLRKSRPEEKK